MSDATGTSPSVGATEAGAGASAGAGATSADASAASAGSGTGSAGAATGASPPPTTTPPTVVTGVRPSMVTVRAWVACEPEAAFDTASATETLPDIFPGGGVIPGVVSARMEGEGVTRMALDETRVVTTNDGKSVREHYIEVDRPRAYAYEMTNLNAPLSMVMSHAVGRWTFAVAPDPDGSGRSGTAIEWTYSAFPKGSLSRGPVALVVGQLRKAMQDCLGLVKVAVEKELPPRWIADHAAARCQSCSKNFGAFTRRHHCRRCGGVFCAKCSEGRMALPEHGIDKAVRVCKSCHSRGPWVPPSGATGGAATATATAAPDAAAAAAAPAAAGAPASEAATA